MGMGIGTGDKRAITAIRQAISSPLLDASIDGAKGILLNVVGGTDLSMSEIDEAASMIQKSVDPEANIIFGAAIDESLHDQIKITVIATRFDDSKLQAYNFNKPATFSSSTETKTIEEAENEEFESSDLDKENLSESFNVKDINPSIDKSNFFSKNSDKDEDEFDIPAFLRKR
jgi:cell division protein FtsZ